MLTPPIEEPPVRTPAPVITADGRVVGISDRLSGNFYVLSWTLTEEIDFAPPTCAVGTPTTYNFKLKRLGPNERQISFEDDFTTIDGDAVVQRTFIVDGVVHTAHWTRVSNPSDADLSRIVLSIPPCDSSLVINGYVELQSDSEIVDLIECSSRESPADKDFSLRMKAGNTYTVKNQELLSNG